MTVYSLVATSELLSKFMLKESANILQQLYKDNGDGIYTRFTATQEPIHDESINLPGGGEVFEGYITPHITLLHYVALNSEEEAHEYIQHIRKEMTPNLPTLRVEGVGLRTSFAGNPYTCYVRFASEDPLMQLRQKALELSKDVINEQTYKEYLSIDYFPHSTILYNDADPKKVTEAKQLFDLSQIEGKIFQIDTLALEKTTLSKGTFSVESF